MQEHVAEEDIVEEVEVKDSIPKINIKPELSIYEKVLEVRKRMPYIAQDKDGYGYKYVSPSRLLGVVRPLLDEYRIWLDYSVLDLQQREIMATKQLKQKGEIPKLWEERETQITMLIEFTILNIDNPDQKIVKEMRIQALGGDVQTAGGLYTYAMRYFLLGFFMVPNDKDDAKLQAKKVQESRAIIFEDALPPGIELDSISRYLEEMATVYEQSISQMKMRATNDMKAFLKSYREWKEKEDA